MNDDESNIGQDKAAAAPAHQDGAGEANAGEPVLVDQPEPFPRLQAVHLDGEEAPKGDVVLILKVDDTDPSQMALRILIDSERMRDDNIAHFFAQWFDRNYAGLVRMASREFNLQQALRESEQRHRIRLVDPHGGFITGD